MTPILYCHPDSGFSYKVALALRLLGIEFEQRQVDIRRPRDQRSQEFRELAAHGEIPVLRIDGRVLCQSNVILDYLAEREDRLDGADLDQRLQVREWLSWEANRVSLNVAHSRYGRQFGGYDPAVLAWYDRRSIADLDRLQAQLSATPWLAGAAPTIADVACNGYLFYAVEPWAEAAGFPARTWAERWPAVQAWQQRLLALPGAQTPQALFAGHEIRY
ncbi:glutathione S-transferase family protein [Lysobacter sp. BMK333-48F3]|uniref:glutathione S-transferase family protein n=1 Tax=Lysobacter sp. BMK333-48F3 TaxID=2867962 RepID=UPI001C8CD9E3|nr:glutathione S-transferase family protein [Lysobacter sp. BMK333-48F3]MBX9403876.1 glutathione S-transferase family protein [Lysobacter sp. BMK333-48F3]